MAPGSLFLFSFRAHCGPLRRRRRERRAAAAGPGDKLCINSARSYLPT